MQDLNCDDTEIPIKTCQEDGTLQETRMNARMRRALRAANRKRAKNGLPPATNVAMTWTEVKGGASGLMNPYAGIKGHILK